MPLILGANSVSGYTVKNSLRFNHNSSDYLNRTPASAGNRRTFTFSFWTKRSKNNSSYPVLFDNGADSNNRDSFFFNEGGTPSTSILQFYCLSSSVVFLDLGTTQVFRDFSAWYHIVLAVDTTQATASNRVKLYINGSQVTSFITATYPSQNTDMNTNSTNPFKVGGSNATSFYYDGYLADYYFIDGQQLTPSSFGETDFDTGIWKPKAYTGTYGTNGFFLKFSNSASLGTDSSGNGNNFTVNNLTSIDQTTDTPTNNFATWNPALATNSTMTLADGNTTGTTASSYASGASNSYFSTFGLDKGKWYAEFKLISATADQAQVVGVGYDLSKHQQGSTSNAYSLYDIAEGWGYIGAEGKVKNNSSNVMTGLSLWYTGDIVCVALDVDNYKLYFRKNGGSWENSGVPTSGATGTGAVSLTSNQTYFFGISDVSLGNTYTFSANFGNPPFTIASGNADANGYGNFEYEVPSGYYALCTKNLAQYG